MEKARIVTGQGVGGFLCPPTHPMLTMRVETDLLKLPENRGSMSLDYAAEDPDVAKWLDPAVIAEAKAILENWHKTKPAITEPRMQAWVHQVLGYFQNAYRGDGPEPECWHVQNLKFIKGGEGDPTKGAENYADHAGVRMIRQYYPEFTPTVEDFQAAAWGKAGE